MLNQSIMEFLDNKAPTREHVIITASQQFGGVTQQVGRALRQGKTVEVVDDLTKINRYIPTDMAVEDLMASIRASKAPKYYFDSNYEDGVVGQYASRAVPLYCIDDLGWLKKYDGQVIAMSYDHYTKIKRGDDVAPCYISQRLNGEMSKYRVVFDHDGNVKFVDPDNGRIQAITIASELKVTRGSWMIVPPEYMDKVNVQGCRASSAWGAKNYNERVRLSGRN